jgi:hypothetical protein
VKFERVRGGGGPEQAFAPQSFPDAFFTVTNDIRALSSDAVELLSSGMLLFVGFLKAA